MLDLFKKQFVFDGGVVTAGFEKTGSDGIDMPEVEPVINVALYGEVGGQANGENSEDDLFVSRNMDDAALNSMRKALMKAQDYTARLVAMYREAEAR